MSQARRLLGTLGEQAACDSLIDQGFRILHRNYRVRGGEIDIVAEQDGTLVRVTVRDEGGPLDDYEVLFEAHRRAGRSGPGSGLGLYVVRQIVRDWGGTVWGRHSYDEPRGNEFGFSIPAAASASGGPVQGGNDARGA